MVGSRTMQSHGSPSRGKGRFFARHGRGVERELAGREAALRTPAAAIDRPWRGSRHLARTVTTRAGSANLFSSR